MKLFKGEILNRSSVPLYVIDTTTNEGVSGKPPAVIHILAPGRKTPKGIDADGFKRVEGKPIQGHTSWWKIRSISTAVIRDEGSDLKSSAILESKVKEDEFGPYEIDSNPGWGEPITDVTSVIKNKKNQTIGYALQNGDRLSLAEAVALAHQGKLDNVYVFKSSKGAEFLRSRPDAEPLNNLKVEKA